MYNGNFSYSSQYQNRDMNIHQNNRMSNLQLGNSVNNINISNGYSNNMRNEVGFTNTSMQQMHPPNYRTTAPQNQQTQLSFNGNIIPSMNRHSYVYVRPPFNPNHRNVPVQTMPYISNFNNQINNNTLRTLNNGNVINNETIRNPMSNILVMTSSNIISLAHTNFLQYNTTNNNANNINSTIAAIPIPIATTSNHDIRRPNTMYMNSPTCNGHLQHRHPHQFRAQSYNQLQQLANKENLMNCIRPPSGQSRSVNSITNYGTVSGPLPNATSIVTTSTIQTISKVLNSRKDIKQPVIRKIELINQSITTTVTSASPTPISATSVHTTGTNVLSIDHNINSSTVVPSTTVTSNIVPSVATLSVPVCEPSYITPAMVSDVASMGEKPKPKEVIEFISHFVNETRSPPCVKIKDFINQHSMTNGERVLYSSTCTICLEYEMLLRCLVENRNTIGVSKKSFVERHRHIINYFLCAQHKYYSEFELEIHIRTFHVERYYNGIYWCPFTTIDGKQNFSLTDQHEEVDLELSTDKGSSKKNYSQFRYNNLTIFLDNLKLTISESLKKFRQRMSSVIMLNNKIISDEAMSSIAVIWVRFVQTFNGILGSFQKYAFFHLVNQTEFRKLQLAFERLLSKESHQAIYRSHPLPESLGSYGKKKLEKNYKVSVDYLAMLSERQKGFNCCCEKFQTIDEGVRHLRQHIYASIHPWHCELCNVRFITSEELISHIKRKNGIAGPTYFCDICSQIFISEKAMAQHNHFTFHQCSVCFEPFSSLVSYFKHDHINENDSNCCISCSAVYSSQPIPSIYSIYHGELICELSKMSCNFCGKYFKNQMELKNHLEICILNFRLYRQCRDVFQDTKTVSPILSNPKLLKPSPRKKINMTDEEVICIDQPVSDSNKNRSNDVEMNEIPVKNNNPPINKSSVETTSLNEIRHIVNLNEKILRCTNSDRCQISSSSESDDVSTTEIIQSSTINVNRQNSSPNSSNTVTNLTVSTRSEVPISSTITPLMTRTIIEETSSTTNSNNSLNQFRRVIKPITPTCQMSPFNSNKNIPLSDKKQTTVDENSINGNKVNPSVINRKRQRTNLRLSPFDVGLLEVQRMVNMNSDTSPKNSNKSSPIPKLIMTQLHQEDNASIDFNVDSSSNMEHSTPKRKNDQQDVNMEMSMKEQLNMEERCLSYEQSIERCCERVKEFYENDMYKNNVEDYITISEELSSTSTNNTDESETNSPIEHHPRQRRKFVLVQHKTEYDTPCRRSSADKTLKLHTGVDDERFLDEFWTSDGRFKPKYNELMYSADQLTSLIRTNNFGVLRMRDIDNIDNICSSFSSIEFQTLFYEHPTYVSELFPYYYSLSGLMNYRVRLSYLRNHLRKDRSFTTENYPSYYHDLATPITSRLLSHYKVEEQESFYISKFRRKEQSYKLKNIMESLSKVEKRISGDIIINLTEKMVQNRNYFDQLFSSHRRPHTNTRKKKRKQKRLMTSEKMIMFDRPFRIIPKTKDVLMSERCTFMERISTTLFHCCLYDVRGYGLLCLPVSKYRRRIMKKRPVESITISSHERTVHERPSKRFRIESGDTSTKEISSDSIQFSDNENLPHSINSSMNEISTITLENSPNNSEISDIISDELTNSNENDKDVTLRPHLGNYDSLMESDIPVNYSNSDNDVDVKLGNVHLDVIKSRVPDSSPDLFSKMHDENNIIISDTDSDVVFIEEVKHNIPTSSSLIRKKDNSKIKDSATRSCSGKPMKIETSEDDEFDGLIDRKYEKPFKSVWNTLPPNDRTIIRDVVEHLLICTDAISKIFDN
ncbi:hypothetical protein SNEBB_003469 [Seison nebaliae]|nr:hypothetical protein SNEBB_003469 [Seison nebaliae]